MISTVSSYSISSTMSNMIANLQKQLSLKQQELSSGVHANLSSTLGSQMSLDTSMHVNLDQLDSIMATNDIVTSRLSITDAALTKMSTDAKSMLSALVNAQNGVVNPQSIVDQANSALGNLVSSLNTSDGSTYVFGGIAGDKPPITDYSAGSAAQKAFVSTFTSAFGFAPSDPAAANITPTQIQSFLTGPAADLFSDQNWTQNWSSASDPLQSRIGPSQTEATSVTANEPTMAKLAAGYSILSSLGLSSLSKSTFTAAVQSVTQTIQNGVSGLNQVQERVGVMTSDVTNAKQSMQAQHDLLSTQIGALEGVDPAQASVEITNLQTQLETAYSLTSQIHKLSLVNYL